jgi:23S rRNA (uracil1939-C5)-methyltransferase
VELRALRIETLASGGAGVAHSDDGRVVFVKGACPGDLLDAEVTADRGRFIEARATAIVEPSADRRTPPCPYFGACGGCQWQHVAYEVQVASKRREVADALHRIGGLGDVQVGDVVTGASPYGYRNRLEMHVAKDAAGHPFLGLAREGSEEIVRIDACLLLPERARSLPKALTGAIRYLDGRTPLHLERVALRAAARTRDIEVDLWAAAGPFPRQAVARTLGDATRASVVTRVLPQGAARRRFDAKVEVLSGRGYWREKLGPYIYRVSAPSFFQVNTALAETTAERVLTALRPDGADRVLDLFAGVGTFTLPIAERAGDVIAIEGTGSALRDLRSNLEDAELSAEVLGGDAARALKEAGRFDLAVVNPPRAGMSPDVTAALIATGAHRIVYVSCDPATLARDAKVLAANGLHLVSAVPVDLFPQTWHVETVALFERPAR